MAACAAILYYFTMPDKKRTDSLDWEDVRYFVALARNGTLSATARALHVNHATVARRIASLEALFGRALFDRRVKGYVLTAEGKAVFGEANAMDEAALSVLRRLDAGTELSGPVRLAVGRVLAERFLIDRLRTFHERYPAIDLEVIGGSRVVSLAKREADVALRYGSPRTASLLPGAWRRSASVFTHRAPIATGSTLGRCRPSSVSMNRATSLPKPRGSAAILATGDFRFALTARRRKLPRLARAMALRFFHDTSWELMSRISFRSRWVSVYQSAMCGFWSAVT
jgi:DNA-binding MarR family transcriptional regulator